MGRSLGHRGGQSAWTASMAQNSWEQAWTVLLFPGQGAWISLKPDFGISGPDMIATGTLGGGLDILRVSFCMCIAFYVCWWLLLLDDARITIT